MTPVILLLVFTLLLFCFCFDEIMSVSVYKCRNDVQGDRSPYGWCYASFHSWRRKEKRSNEVSNIIVAFYSYHPVWAKRNEGILYCGVLWHIFAIWCERTPSSHPELQPAIIHFPKSLSSKMHATSILIYVYMIKYLCDEWLTERLFCALPLDHQHFFCHR